jgi:tRNA pseudouridine55 synthase
MDGVLLIDKPSGPTSHDVVARLRNTTGERSIGHTGTLDPDATGLLPLVLGRATRLASFFSKSEKTYEATIRWGYATDTDDAAGVPIGPASDARPAERDVDLALGAFRGSFLQVPPQHSAKKVGGARAYDLARGGLAVALAPVQVTIDLLDVLRRTDDVVQIRLRASAGFYVRALARDLGIRLGCGAHLTALRRTSSGAFTVSESVTLAEAEREGPDVRARLLSPADALSGLPAVRVTELGLKRASHGNSVGPEHFASAWPPPSAGGARVRILGPEGALVAVAEARGGALHPLVVLGYN